MTENGGTEHGGTENGTRRTENGTRRAITVVFDKILTVS